MRTQIWSSGGGVQSTAIAALICQGELSPDLSVIVDTERERSTTWEYLDKYVDPALKAAGVKLHRVKKSDYATVDLYRNDDILIPAFTTESGETGKLPTFCSNEWKQRVMRRWATDQGVVKADIWMGFTIDEKQRMKIETGKWQYAFPLIERRMSRGDCMALVKRMGWPEPPRSACYMCPNATQAEWAWQKKNAPKDHARAVEFENAIRTKDSELWLTQQAIPLKDITFDENLDLFGNECNTGMCFV